MSQDSPTTPFEQVFQKELGQIAGHRKERAVVTDGTEQSLVGLSFSGGGIRSATFNLGVLQALKKLGLLKFVDYLSTVSGGGYIGSWFVANRLREQQRSLAEKVESGDLKPDDFLEGKGSFAIHHLRRFSRYLSPEQGFMNADFWTMAAIWFRNTILIQAIVFCVLGVLLLLPWAWVWVLSFLSDSMVNNSKSDTYVIVGIQLLLVALVVGVSLSQIWLLKRTPVAGEKNEHWSRKKHPFVLGTRGVQFLVILPMLGAALLAASRLFYLTSICFTNFWENRLAWVVAGIIGVLTTGLALASILRVRGEPAKAGESVSLWIKLLPLFLIVLTVLNVGWMQLASKTFTGVMNVRLGEARQENATDNAKTLLTWENDQHTGKLVYKESEGTKKPEEVNPAGGAVTAEKKEESCKPTVSGRFLAAVIGPPIFTLLYSMVIVVMLGLAGKNIRDSVREWWSRVGAYLTIYSVAGILLCTAAIFGPVLLDWAMAKSSAWVQGGALTAWLGTLAGSLFAGSSNKTNGKEANSVLNKVAVFGPYVVMIGLILGEAYFLRCMLSPGSGPVAPYLSDDGGFLNGMWGRWWAMLVVLSVSGAVLIWRVDLNEFSMNQFYRNRLSRCYLGGSRVGDERHPHPFTGFDFQDDLRLPVLEEGPSRGPYLLVNTALNTAQGGDLEVQERMAEAFLLSPAYCGFERRRATDGGAGAIPQPSCEEAHLSPTTGERYAFQDGYRPTSQYIYAGEDALSLGTAVSISGAAASPNGGYHTAPVTAFLMTLFNARLGWWVPHPARARWQNESPGWYLWYLLKELMGSASRKDEFVYLSDGGHFDNIGIYELVRRRCRLIIVGDAEQDGDLTFHALGSAIRRCRIDFGAEIDIVVSDIRNRDPQKCSAAHCAVGTIAYADGSTGILVYLKSSLTGDESADVLQYYLQTPEFPHESTGDQFFSESQFESYRALGEHIANAAFSKVIKNEDVSGSRLAGVVDGLAARMHAYWKVKCKEPAKDADKEAAVA